MNLGEGQRTYLLSHQPTDPVVSSSSVCSRSNMKLILSLGLIVAASFCSCQNTNRDLRDVVKGKFSSKLYTDVSNSSPNVIISPMSLKLVLTLSLLGAGGSTGSQITRALDLPQDRKQMESGFQALTQRLQSNTEMTLTVANKLFIADNYDINPTFVSEAQQVFQSGAENLDFKNAPEPSRQVINTWVAEETNQTIQNLIPPGGITKGTVLVMVNTLYLKASWKHRFLEVDTTRLPFRVTSSLTRTVDMMHTLYKDMYYQSFDGYTAVEMPYKGDVVSMLVLLPDAVDGLSELETKLENQDWSNISLSNKYNVHLWIPKFKMENTWSLDPILKELGMTEMFTNNANFTGISVPSPSVSSVAQKAFIEINENGTIASAATAIVTVTEAMEPPPNNYVEFRADHPFMLMIRETSTGAILFCGKVVEPEYFSA